MQVGVNYPWFDYGWDFGVAPPGWRGGATTPRWYPDVDGHLRHFQSLGIAVVRWFILADGLTYGVARDAPLPDPVERGRWRFSPPPLSREFLEHFAELLTRFAAAQAAGRSTIQLLPVLVDFHFCNPGTRPVERLDPVDPTRPVEDPDWVKQGRADALTDPLKRREFLDRTLEPLLRICLAHRNVIYAWELINEPDWITTGWNPRAVAPGVVSDAAMRAFLDEGKQRIRAAGYRPTIGFASMTMLQRSGITAEVNQFHHYPAGAQPLERHVFDPRFPGILGEFATASTDIWPELGIQRQTVLARLQRAESQGYPLAIPWSFRARDRHTSWSAETERDIKAFTQHVPPETVRS